MNATSVYSPSNKVLDDKNKRIKELNVKKQDVEQNIDFLLVKLNLLQISLHNLSNKCVELKDSILTDNGNFEIENSLEVQSMINEINGDYNQLLSDTFDFNEHKKTVENNLALLNSEVSLIELNLRHNHENLLKLEEKNINLYKEIHRIDCFISSQSIASQDTEVSLLKKLFCFNKFKS